MCCLCWLEVWISLTAPDWAERRASLCRMEWRENIFSSNLQVLEQLRQICWGKQAPKGKAKNSSMVLSSKILLAVDYPLGRMCLHGYPRVQKAYSCTILNLSNTSWFFQLDMMSCRTLGDALFYFIIYIFWKFSFLTSLKETNDFKCLLHAENGEVGIILKPCKTFWAYFPPIVSFYVNRLLIQLFHAWRCDRILWYGQGLNQLSYVRGESRFSDHRPVYGDFLAEVESINRGQMKKSMSCASSRIEVEELLPYSQWHMNFNYFH